MIGTVVLALLSEAPWLGASMRTLLLLGAFGALLFVLAGSRAFSEEDLPGAFLRGPNPFMLALLVWCAGSALFGAPYRGHALAEMLRVALGVGVYFAAARALRSDELPVLTWTMLALGVVVCLIDFGRFGAGATAIQTVEDASIFGNHENQGSFLLVLLPVALAFALHPGTGEKPRLAAQATALILGAGLLLARTRAAWIGGAAAFLVVSVLFALASGMAQGVTARARVRSRLAFLFPLALVVFGLGLLVVMGNIAPLLGQRTATFARIRDDSSLADRLHRWRGAARMASERPVAGWGLGMWPLFQGRWTHQGDDTHEVLRSGTGHQNLAHNYWVQWAAETGAVGLALHVGAVAAFVALGLNALRNGRVASPTRTALLIGCLASVVGACVDAVGSPAYNYAGVSTLWWLWMGTGVAAALRSSSSIERAENAPGADAARPAAWAAAAGLLAAAVVLGAGYQLRSGSAGGRGRGVLSVSAQTIGPAPDSGAGSLVLWTASFRNAAGQIRPTTPGTLWSVRGTKTGDQNGPVHLFRADEPDLSGWRAIVPQGAAGSPATATATYWDESGRRYTASAQQPPDR